MKTFWYDEEFDILDLTVDDGKYWRTIELPNGVNVDITKKGKIIGLEIFRASKLFSNAKEIIEHAKKEGAIKPKKAIQQRV